VIERSLSVLVVSPSETGGGAEMVAAELFDACRRSGLRMQIAVATKRTDDSDVIEIPNDSFRSWWARMWLKTAGVLRRPKIRNLGEPMRWLRRFRGHEDMEFPASHHLLDLANPPPQIVHAHNLHGGGTGFFDLRALPELARRVPVILTLHDAWLLAGHCAHSFDCDRWETGCGRCPYLSVPERIRRDGSAANFALKKRIFERSSLHISTPSEWLMKRAQRSLLAPAIKTARVIPNGVDLGCFRPGDKNNARKSLGLDENDKIILCVGNTLKHNIWRDFATALAAAKEAATGGNQTTVLMGLGDSGNRIIDGNLEVRFEPRRGDPLEVARHYQAADLLLHSSRADTFPSVVLEAMACGLPVVATAVGGIPEQVVEGDTGFLVTPGDVTAMTGSMVTLLENPELRLRFGDSAAKRTARHFDRSLMVDRYLEWYRQLAALTGVSD